MTTESNSTGHLGVLLAAGPDARGFLQGQLTADLNALTPTKVLLAAINSPQGRVQSIVWLIERREGIAMLLARSMLDTTLQRLRRYVLRSKVTLDPERLQVGFAPAERVAEGSPEHAQVEDRSIVRWPAHRQAVVIAPTTRTIESLPRAEAQWRDDHLRSGHPQIYPPTHERFVAQMLNLDLLGGISFEKGCYTGQEIIARTHYRGAIKRRMFHFRASTPPPIPGTRLLSGDQHAGDVVDSIATSTGSEILAVVNLAQKDEPLRLEGSDGTLERLDLPYRVEEE